MRWTLIVATTALALAFATGCKSSNEEVQPAATSPQEPTQAAAEPARVMKPGGMMAQMRESCPLTVDGTTVEVSDTDRGVAITFTGGSDVGELRAKTRRMGEMYAMHGGHRGMMWHHMGGKMAGMDHAAGGMDMAGKMMPAAIATVEDVDGGARLLLAPTDAAQLEALRAHARMHRERMHSGKCPMLNSAAE